MIFADKQYPVNIKNGKSFVYPANSLSLGDNILMTIIDQAIFRDNPDEAISLVPFSEDIVKLARAERPDKVFLRMDATCVTDREIVKLKRLTQVFEFELHRECHELWKQGIYPVFSQQSSVYPTKQDFVSLNSYQSLISNVQTQTPIPSFQLAIDSQLNKHWIWDFGKEYVAFHIRNINKIKSKNTDPEYVERILDYLIDVWLTKGGESRCIVLVGNDESYGKKIDHLDYDTVIDFRKKMTLEEIFTVIKHSKLFIGSDSGIAHLAGCCDVPIVSWGYVNEYWFPKVRNFDDCLFLIKEESRIEVVLESINKKLDFEL